MVESSHHPTIHLKLTENFPVIQLKLWVCYSIQKNMIISMQINLESEKYLHKIIPWNVTVLNTTVKHQRYLKHEHQIHNLHWENSGKFSTFGVSALNKIMIQYFNGFKLSIILVKTFMNKFKFLWENFNGIFQYFPLCKG